MTLLKTHLLSDFCNLNIGRWTTLRTSYCISSSLMYIYKSNIYINTSLHEFHNTKRKEFYIDRKNNISTNLTYLSYKPDSSQDISNNEFQKLSSWSHFVNKANHISYSYKINNLLIYEKCFLINPNVRLHVNTVYKKNKCICVSFSSDIKKV
uniref:Uncharacterized protein n=1 Tax=Hommersandiophycus borowitzkae TaxID=268573 RepID=A0A1G4NUG7_9FLOR|nr:Hypothetical protein ycf58 [Hommersandiophycus borowitzkae]SCW22149.1 Hypothetical protein ycf58 [Hommersandiophycus borowitzkae]